MFSNFRTKNMLAKPTLPSDTAVKALAGTAAISIMIKNPIPVLLSIPYAVSKCIKKTETTDKYIDNTILPAACILTSVTYIYKFETLDVITSKGLPLVTKLF